MSAWLREWMIESGVNARVRLICAGPPPMYIGHENKKPLSINQSRLGWSWEFRLSLLVFEFCISQRYARWYPCHTVGTRACKGSPAWACSICPGYGMNNSMMVGLITAWTWFVCLTYWIGIEKVFWLVLYIIVNDCVYFSPIWHWHLLTSLPQKHLSYRCQLSPFSHISCIRKA